MYNPTVSLVDKVREIAEAGGEATAAQVDVRHFEDVEEMVKETVKKYKRIDVLVCMRK